MGNKKKKKCDYQRIIVFFSFLFSFFCSVLNLFSEAPSLKVNTVQYFFSIFFFF